MGGELSHGNVESGNKGSKSSRHKHRELEKVDSRDSIQSTNQNTEPKSHRGSVDNKMKRKKEKIAIIAKNKVSSVLVRKHRWAQPF